jgi:hypothetical protein
VSGYETFQLAVIVVMFAFFMLSRAADRHPNSDWLQTFRRFFPRPSEEQKRRAGRRAAVYAGVQFILLGITLPFAFMVLEVMMFFSETTVTEMVVVGSASLLCIGLGIVAIWRNRR